MSWWAYCLLLLAAGLAAWIVVLLFQLRQARNSAEASRMINDRLFASIGHEVRSPMTGIVGMTSLLQETELTASQRKYLQSLRWSSESLLEIIADVVDFGKIESRRLELEQTAFDLRACVEASLDRIVPAAAGKGLELGYWFEIGTPEALIGDEPRIGRILGTLLSNSVKLTASGEVMVEVSAAPREDGHEISFSVRDTGVGWRADDVIRLLEPFGQADAELSRRYGGIGIGLAVGKRLSELMGGRMWLAETADTGSTFCFSIRARKASGPDRSDLYRPHPALAGKRVMVVAENAAVNRLVSRQVEILGMRPQSAATSAEALEHLETESRGDESCELAIIDQQTLAADGIGWEERLEQEFRRRNLPVLQLAALGAEEPAPARESPARRRISKPLRALHFYDSLLELAAAGEPTSELT